MTSLRSLVVLAFAGTLLPAQDLPPAPFDAADFLVPIHAPPAGDDSAELWARGRAWKASFHDGFVFYPRPGIEHDGHLPFRYRLDDVSVGGEPLVDERASPRPVWTPMRCEYRHGRVTEAYDVRADGVEQTFVLAERPVGAGDLRITGTVETALCAPAQAERHGALTFCDGAGRPVVRYGEAFAFDATGRRVPVATAFDGTRITLVVGAAFLAEAVYPVTVDPLTSRVVINFSATFFDRYYKASLTRNSATGQLLLVYGQSFGTSDVDTLAYVTDASFGSRTLVYSRLGVSKIAFPYGAAFVGGSARYALTYSLTTGVSPSTSIVVYLHNSGNTTLNSGNVLTQAPGAGEFLGFPDIGGSDGARAMLVYEKRTGTTMHEVVGQLVNAGTNTLGTAFALSTVPAGTTFLRERPSISSQSNTSGGSWIAVWHEQDKSIAGDDFDLRASRISAGGAVAGIANVGPDTGTPAHKYVPRVDGSNGRYLVAWQQQDTGVTSGFGLQIGAQRFDWSETSATPVLKEMRVVDTDAGATLRNLEIAIDSRTQSHWALCYQRTGGASVSTMVVKRLGYTAATVETQSFNAQVVTGFAATYDAPGVTFDPQNRRFPFAHPWQEVFLTGGTTSAAIHAQHLTYPSDAINTLYGTGCGGTISAPEPPYAGHEFYSVDLSGALPNVLAVCEIAFLPANINVGFIGMPGCFQNVDPFGGYIIGITGTTTSSGTMRLTIPVQDLPPFQGDLYFMYAHVAPGANPLGLLATQGLKAQYR